MLNGVRDESESEQSIAKVNVCPAVDDNFEKMKASEREQGIAKTNACPAVDERFIKMNLSKGGESAPGAPGA